MSEPTTQQDSDTPELTYEDMAEVLRSTFETSSSRETVIKQDGSRVYRWTFGPNVTPGKQVTIESSVRDQGLPEPEGE